MTWSEKERAVARAICRVQLNGGDPDQPAVRWNGTEMEPQDFPVWQDHLDEARHALDASAAVDGDAQWNAAIEAAARVADDDDQGLAYAGQYNNWAMREDALRGCAAAIRSLKRG